MRLKYKRKAGGLALVAGLAVVAGCASGTANIESARDLADANLREPVSVVFGKLRLVRNGEEVSFGPGLFANSARLTLQQSGGERQFAGRVGRDGEFSWALPAGDYSVESIAFRVQDRLVSPETSFRFTVSPEHDASYLGTITLEATFDAGYLGVHGGVDRFLVHDDCASDCARRLAQFGVADSRSTRSLVRWDYDNQ